MARLIGDDGDRDKIIPDSLDLGLKPKRKRKPAAKKSAKQELDKDEVIDKLTEALVAAARGANTAPAASKKEAPEPILRLDSYDPAEYQSGVLGEDDHFGDFAPVAPRIRVGAGGSSIFAALREQEPGFGPLTTGKTHTAELDAGALIRKILGR